MPILIEGVKVNLAGRDFVMPPLTLKHLRVHGPIIKGLQNMQDVPGPEQVGGITTLIHAALSRNYPDLTREEVEDMVDVSSLKATFGAMMGQSGFTQATGEGSGEVNP